MGASTSHSLNNHLFSIPIQNSDDLENGKGPIMENPISKSIKDGPKCSMTLYTNFLHGHSISGTSRCFGTRIDTNKSNYKLKTKGKFQWITYNDVLTMVVDISSAIKTQLYFKRNDFVGVFSKNRYEWCLVEHACSRMTYPLVPLYDTLGISVIPFIINHTKMKLIFGGKEQIHLLIQCINECPNIKSIVQFEEPNEKDIQIIKETKSDRMIRFILQSSDLIKKEELDDTKTIYFISFKEFKRRGSEIAVPADPPTPNDIATICYTSGTTGNPKGPIITHNNIISGVLNINKVVKVNKYDSHLSYLPLAHVFERIIQAILINAGASIAFYQGDVALLTDDLQLLKPTIFPSVPRLFNRVHDKVQQNINKVGGLKKKLFEYAYHAKVSALLMNTNPTSLETTKSVHYLWDKLVFDKMKSLLGGNVRMIISGSAPLSDSVKTFLRVAFCCDVYEGYGLTETCGVTTVATPMMPLGPHVGAPVPSIQVRLVDVKEMNYTSKDKPNPRGEIAIRGPTVFGGYYNDQDKTKECMDAEGWFYTGDIGSWNKDGTLRIIDRKKNIFKLSQGEYVAPEKLENIYSKAKYVAQCYVHGDPEQSCLLAIIVPDSDLVMSLLSQDDKNIVFYGKTFKDICQSKEFKIILLDNLGKIGKSAGVKGFECIKDIYIDSQPFTVENDLITPTFKFKRPQIKKYYNKQIESMYKEIGNLVSS